MWKAEDGQRSAYNPGVHPDVQELQPKLKEILYDCAVEIRATKAALFLYDGSSRFELVTEYGFRGAIRQSADTNDPIIDRCGRGRSAFFINGIGVEPRFSELLYESSTDRLLAAPIYSRGTLVGVIDIRDKAAKAPFENSDLAKAQRIAERVAELFLNKNIFGQRFITLSGADDHVTVVHGNAPVHTASAPQSASAAAPVPKAPPPAASPSSVRPAPAPAQAHQKAPQPPAAGRVPRLSTLILEARTVADRVVIPTTPESLGENELAVIRD